MQENYNNWIAGMAVLAFVVAMAMDVVDLDIAVTVAAWLIPETHALSSAVHNNNNNMKKINKNHHRLLQPKQQLLPNKNRRRSMFMADDEVAADETSETPSPMSFLESAEWKIMEDLHEKASRKVVDDSSSSSENDEDAFQAAAEELLPALSPTLIMKLRSGDALVPEDARDDNSNDRLLKVFSEVSKALNTMTDRRLESAREVLRELMTAGEIKKLDAKIGEKAREKKLDVAFFQVLQVNIQDAATDAQKATAIGEEDSAAVNRSQILQHIYTRCQEEVEKVINPGMALLNKLLRTEVDSIRQNQLNHYLCPKPTTITSPDGKELVLNNGIPSKPLVAQDDFCEAIGNAVKQIRTVEKSGATTPEIAADLVETVRTVAKEARFIIGEHFGANSTQVIGFEEALEPIFRPVSADSVYIQGEA